MLAFPVKRFGIGALYFFMSAVFCWPLFAKPLGLGGNDWDQHLFYYSSVLKNVIEYGQPPFWNPWYCGGDVMWQNPQIAVLSPVYPLALLMPIQLAMKINILLHYFFGFVGMHVLLTRTIGLRSLPVTIYLAALGTVAGATTIHVAVGHSNFLPAMYLPWLFYFFFAALETGEARPALIAGAILSLMVWNGGPHIWPMALAAIGAFTLAAAVLRRQWRPLLLAVVVTTSGVAFAAPKLIPVSLFATSDRFWDTRNPTGHPDVVTREMLRHVYLDSGQSLRTKVDQQRHNWQEYGNYIGPFSALVVTAALAWMIVSRLELAITAAFLFLLSLGEFSAYAPASLITRLPLFSSFRIPSRYSIPFVFVSVIAAAWAAKDLLNQRWFRAPAARAALGAVCVIAAAHLMFVNRQLFTNVFDQDPFDTSFHWMSGPNQITSDFDSSPYKPGAPMLHALMTDRAFYYCYESLQLKRTSTASEPVIGADGDVQVVSTTFTPNRFEMKVVSGAKEPRIWINQNYGPGWSSTAGPFVLKPDPMLAVKLAPGQTGTFAFTFVPPGLIAGFALFAVALVSAVFLWRRSLWRPPSATR